MQSFRDGLGTPALVADPLATAGPVPVLRVSRRGAAGSSARLATARSTGTLRRAAPASPAALRYTATAPQALGAPPCAAGSRPGSAGARLAATGSTSRPGSARPTSRPGSAAKAVDEPGPAPPLADAAAAAAAAADGTVDVTNVVGMLRKQLQGHAFAYLKPRDEGAEHAEREGNEQAPPPQPQHQQPSVGGQGPALRQKAVANPYELAVVPFGEHLHASGAYVTLSEAGVTRFVPRAADERATGDRRGGYIEYTGVFEWEAERAAYGQLEKIPFFRLYPRWKAHLRWKQQLQSSKRRRCIDALSEQLFVLDADLAPALLKVQSLCVDLLPMQLHAMPRSGATAQLPAARAAQRAHAEACRARLAAFEAAVERACSEACASALDTFTYNTAIANVGDHGGATGAAAASGGGGGGGGGVGGGAPSTEATAATAVANSAAANAPAAAVATAVADDDAIAGAVQTTTPNVPSLRLGRLSLTERLERALLLASQDHGADRQGSRSFLEVAQLRRMHARLGRFLRACDHLVHSTLLQIVHAGLERLRDGFERALELPHVPVAVLHVSAATANDGSLHTPEWSTPGSNVGSRVASQPATARGHHRGGLQRRPSRMVAHGATASSEDDAMASVVEALDADSRSMSPSTARPSGGGRHPSSHSSPGQTDGGGDDDDGAGGPRTAAQLAAAAGGGEGAGLLFTVQLALDEGTGQLRQSPTSAEWHAFVDEWWLQGAISTVCATASMRTHQSLRQYVCKADEVAITMSNAKKNPKAAATADKAARAAAAAGAAGGAARLRSLVHNSVGCVQAAAALRVALSTHLDSVAAHARTFAPLVATHGRNVAFDAPALLGEGSGAPLASFRRRLDDYAAQLVALRQLSPAARVGVFCADATRLRAALLPAPQRCLDAVHSLLPSMASQRSQQTMKKASAAASRLAEPPTDVKGFVSFSAFLGEVGALQAELSGKWDDVQSMHDLMHASEIPLPDVDRAGQLALESLLIELRAQIATHEAAHEEQVLQWSQRIDAFVSELRSAADGQRLSSEVQMLYDGATDVATALNFLGEAKTRADGLAAQCATYVSYQKALKLLPTKHDELRALQQSLRVKTRLWESVDGLECASAEWLTTNLEQIDADQMAEEVARYAQVAAMCERSLPSNTVLPRLRALLAQYDAMVPAVRALRNPHLKARHWQRIAGVLGRAVVRDELCTLSYLLRLKVHEPHEQLSAISVEASQEEALSAMLERVKSGWSKAEFEVRPYKDAKDSYILGDVEETLAMLEETQLVVQAVVGSRYVAPLLSEAEGWRKRLSLLAEVLEVWLTLQQSWMYLESVFAAADMQRQLPQELRAFSAADKTWRELMKKVHTDPLVIRHALPQVLESLQKGVATLERVQQRLEAYLEVKRAAFPRFFFLSNDELLEILGNARNPHAVQPHLPKCFDAVKRLEFVDEAKSSGATPLVEAWAMRSAEGERLPFIDANTAPKPVKARGAVDEWLTRVESAMVYAINRNLRTGLHASVEAPSRVGWARSHGSQVVLGVAQICWTSDVALALEAPPPRRSSSGSAAGGNSNRNALLLVHINCVAHLAELATTVATPLSELERRTLVALIVSDVHHRDVTETLTRRGVMSVGDFSWQMQLRFEWQSDDVVGAPSSRGPSPSCGSRSASPVPQERPRGRRGSSSQVGPLLADGQWSFRAKAAHVALGWLAARDRPLPSSQPHWPTHATPRHATPRHATPRHVAIAFLFAIPSLCRSSKWRPTAPAAVAPAAADHQPCATRPPPPRRPRWAVLRRCLRSSCS